MKIFIDKVVYRSFCKTERKIKTPQGFIDINKDICLLNNVNPNLNKNIYFDLGTKNLMDILFLELIDITEFCENNLIIFGNWIACIDINVGSLGVWVKRRYQLRASILDICDVGSLCQFVTIDVSYNLIKASEGLNIFNVFHELAINNSNKGESMILPQNNFVSSVLMSAKNSGSGLEVLKVYFDNNFDDLFKQLMNSLSDLHALSGNNKVSLYCRESERYYHLYKIINYCKCVFNVYKIKYPVSSGFLGFCLNKISVLKNGLESSFFVVLDKDFSSDRVAACLLRMK